MVSHRIYSILAQELVGNSLNCLQGGLLHKIPLWSTMSNNNAVSRHVYFSRLNTNNWGIFSQIYNWRIYTHCYGDSTADGEPPQYPPLVGAAGNRGRDDI